MGKVYTPEGYLNDPPDAECPYCGEKNKPCSFVNSLARGWARQACSYKHKGVKQCEQ
jgi:hypothetical protein